MSLIDKIEKLQKKPEPYRRRVLFITTILIMVLIIIFWVSFLDFSLEKEKIATKKNPEPFDVIKKDLGTLKNNTVSFWTRAKGLLNELNKLYGEEKR